ncbi:MAG: hypothetical protein WCV73_00680 [Patescibacteria group bacterium]|jgi:phosphoribosylamine--glycine ligase
MRVLFISGELIAGDIAYRLKQEGCDVKLFIEDKSRKDCFDGMVKKTNDWQKELKWVGKKGLIIFDDVGYGKIQDYLRKDGYKVMGGCEIGDKMERDREFGQKIFKSLDINTLETFNFQDINIAINFVKKHRCKWVIKQNGHISALNYIGKSDDANDVLSTLKTYEKYLSKNVSISLQRKVEGVEIGIARYFNGFDWIGPIEFNIEHKAFMNHDIGPSTAEMGTVMWYNNDNKNKLFQETLEKFKPLLQKINFRGDIDINFIINGNKVYPLEITSRLGSPSTHLQTEIHSSGWKDFFYAVANGDKYNLNYRRGYGVVVSIAIPPFPYKGISSEYYLKGTNILFKDKLTSGEWKKIHFEEVSLSKSKNTSNYYISGANGYILYVTGFGKSITSARNDAYSLVDKIIIPKMMFRTDIGLKFMERDKKLLKKWGWI